jgi:hypothetical protein
MAAMCSPASDERAEIEPMKKDGEKSRPVLLPKAHKGRPGTISKDFVFDGSLDGQNK